MTESSTLDPRDDDGLVRLIAAVTAVVQPVPAVGEEIALDAFRLRMADTVIGDLLHDSAYDEALAVRGGERTVAYALGSHRIDLVVEADGTIAGTVHPPDASLEVQFRVGGGTVDVDPTGSFELTPPSHQLRFVLTAPGESPMTTPWLTV